MSFYKKKPFPCPYCEKEFNKERKLKSHIKDSHPESLEKKTLSNGYEVCSPAFAQEMREYSDD